MAPAWHYRHFTGGLCLLAGMLMSGMSWAATILMRTRFRRSHPAHPLYPTMLALVALGALTEKRAIPFPLLAAARHVRADAGFGLFTFRRDGEAGVFPHGAPLAGDGRHGCVDLDHAEARSVHFALGAYAAIFQLDLKGLLAYSTISHLGLITLLLGMNSELASIAAIFHMINHATFKASLFMAAGIVDHETGTRDYAAIGTLSTHADHGDACRRGGRNGRGTVLNGLYRRRCFLRKPYLSGPLQCPIRLAYSRR